MKTPPLLLGLALLFWGVETGFTIYAAIMAIVLESAHVIKTRWEFTEKEYNRVFDLCGLLLLGGLAIASTSDDIRIPALALALWFPFIFFPIMAAQAHGAREKLTMRTLNWFFLRRRKTGLANKEFNIAYLYFALCILSASAAAPGGRTLMFGAFGVHLFYLGVAFLLGWALVASRSRRIHGAIWMLLIGCIVSLGQVGHLGLQELQKQLESAVTNWVGRFARFEGNMMESQTAIGRIGRLKLSGKIVLRVEPESGSMPPALLRQMSYDTFNRGVWKATRQDSELVAVDAEDVWKVNPDAVPRSFARISGNLFRGSGILALPAGTVSLQDLPVGSLTTNYMGMAKVENGPKFVRYLAGYSPTNTFDSPPMPMDLEHIPVRDIPVFETIADELGLTVAKTTEEKLDIMRQFFLNNFTYSTYITPRHRDFDMERSPLEIFLTDVRSGHCEYFATAAVLLSRAAGIPARYATGFAVDEQAGVGNMYVVRERHAHAWALIYRNGVWEDFDVTPPSWEEVEAKNESFWQPFKDFWSRIGYEFSKWRYSESDFRKYGVWLLVPLVVLLIWRIMFRKRSKQKRTHEEDSGEPVWPGLDSELYAMQQELSDRGLSRKPTESLLIWKERVAKESLVPAEKLAAAVDLHARHRFDPKGLSAEERLRLRDLVTDCRAAIRALPAPQETVGASSQAG